MSERYPQGIGDLEQPPVTGSVAARVVDRLEAVDIDERQCERLPCPSRPGYLAF